MIELLVYCGIFSLAVGIMLGWFRMLWLLGNIATAGALALAVHALQMQHVKGAMAGVEIEGTLFVEIVLLATLGWAFGRWRRDVEG